MKSLIARSLIFCLFALMLTACGKRIIEANSVSISESVQLKLLPPASFGKSIELTQIAEISYQDQTQEVLFQVEISPKKIVLVGLTPSGTRIFTLIYDGQVIDIEGIATVIEKIKPEFILADMQLAYWPKSELLKQLSGSALMINDSQNSRSLFSEQEEIVRIDYSKSPTFTGKMDFSHQLRNYQLSIETLDYQLITMDPK